MKDIVYLPAGMDLVKFTKSKEDTEIISSTGLNIDWKWVIEEAGIVKYRGQEYPVEAGDIFLLCYAPYIKRTGDETTRIGIVIKSPELYDNYKKCQEYYYKRDKCSNCSGDCTNCSCGCSNGDSVAKELVD